MIIIRPEKPEDFKAIYELNKLTFEGEFESQLIDKIRQSKDFIPELSLVALKDNKIVGHILFSRVKIKSKDTEKTVLTLAPMAVLPEFQNKGIGSLLVKKGLEISKSLDYYIIVVVGHLDYYPRFGFSKGSEHGLQNAYGVDEPFMVMELREGALLGHRCHV